MLIKKPLPEILLSDSGPTIQFFNLRKYLDVFPDPETFFFLYNFIANYFQMSRIFFEISKKVQKSLITSIRDRLHRY
jgi:hypothetical protein